MDAVNPPPAAPVPPLPGAPALAAGRVLGGRYRLEERIAAGGMASVWEAVDEVLARRVAVKVLHPHLAADAQFVARFRREALAAARLTHPCIVSIYDTCTDTAPDGTITDAIVMELVRGTTLRAELDRVGRFEPSAAAAVVAVVCDALGAAHAAGIVHRDVKPANVLLSTDGRVLVADFGIAKAGDGLDLTGADTTLGTAKYLAPEQVAGEPVDARADVYAAGVILYELLCGRPPFVADTEAATALARLHRDPEPPRSIRPELPAWLDSVVLRALARDPSARVASAAALRDALRSGGRSDGGPPTVGVAVAAPPTTALGPDPTRAIDTTHAHPSGFAGAVPGPSPTPAAGSPAPAAPVPAGVAPHPPPPERPPRRWATWVLGTIVLAAVAVVGVLLAQSGGGGGSPEDRTPSAPPPEDQLAIAVASSFDPAGDDGEENEDLVGALLDDDPTTTWRTSCYSSPAFGNLKAGVGVVLELDSGADLGALEVAATAPGWSAQAFVADEPASDLAGWGEPAGSVEATADAATTIGLDGASGRFVLLWFTALPPTPSADCGGQPFGVTVTDVAIG